MKLPLCILLLVSAYRLNAATNVPAPPLTRICTSPDRTHLLYSGTTNRFIAWGFNYDRDDSARLLEDYWANEWPKVTNDFREMKKLGANVVRIHLQLARFMKSPVDACTRGTSENDQ